MKFHSFSRRKKAARKTVGLIPLRTILGNVSSKNATYYRGKKLLEISGGASVSHIPRDNFARILRTSELRGALHMKYGASLAGSALLVAFGLFLLFPCALGLAALENLAVSTEAPKKTFADLTEKSTKKNTPSSEKTPFGSVYLDFGGDVIRPWNSGEYLTSAGSGSFGFGIRPIRYFQAGLFGSFLGNFNGTPTSSATFTASRSSVVSKQASNFRRSRVCLVARIPVRRHGKRTGPADLPPDLWGNKCARSDRDRRGEVLSG